MRIAGRVFTSVSGTRGDGPARSDCSIGTTCGTGGELRYDAEHEAPKGERETKDAARNVYGVDLITGPGGVFVLPTAPSDRRWATSRQIV